jgi:rare lipoprotein A
LCAFHLPVLAQDQVVTGECSYYTDKWHGRKTSSGEKYDRYLFTAAHRTLPFNTLVKVTNIKNDRSCVVRIIDRGPYIKGRILDLSGAAARELGMMTDGVIFARIEIMGMANGDSLKAFFNAEEANLEGNDGTASVKDQVKKEPEMKQEVHRVKHVPIKPTFYNLGHQAVTPRGFGVQLGTYGSYSSCKNAMNNLVARYGAQAFMYVVENKNIIQYRLLMGQFGSVTSAESFKKAIQKDHPNSFIVSYSAM